MSLRNKAMIVRLSISDWRARKFDANATEDFHKSVGANEGSGRYNKVLIAKEALEDVHKAISEARRFHKEYTSAWDDNAGRVLSVMNFDEYSKGMRGIISQFDKAVKGFVAKYPELRDAARETLNGLFNINDYPSTGNIKHRFAMSTTIEPIPDAGDFRVDLEDKEIARIKKELKAEMVDRESLIDKDNFKRIYEALIPIKEKLSDPEAIFRDSLIENLVEAVERIPSLNVTNNGDLKKVNDEAKKKLASLEPDNLRNDEDARSQAAQDAEEILKKMAAYTG